MKCTSKTRTAALLALFLVTACSAAPVRDAEPPIGAVGEGCPAQTLGQHLGVDRLMVGGMMADESFDVASFDIRYVYLVGPVPTSPCASCADDCAVQDASCANDAGGCPWWGCWQYDGVPPGHYVVDFIDSVRRDDAIPMFTYYVWLGVAGTEEGVEEVDALDDSELVASYLADWRFFCDTVGAATQEPVIAHVEPDLWGFGHQMRSNPDGIPVAVSAAVAPECAELPDTLAGLSRCMLAIARSNAPNLLVGFNASSWGAGEDVNRSTDAGLDLVAHARETADYMIALGAAEADLVVVEMSDRDAGVYGVAWDERNRTVPNFDRAVAWVAMLSTNMGVAPLWWQVPYGHEGLENTSGRYEDNRVAYFFDNPDQFAAGGAIGIAFGAGDPSNTSPETDEGYFLERAGEYYEGERPCLCGVCQ